MKTMLKIASVLTWFNVVFWGAGVVFGLLYGLLNVQLPYLLLFVLLSAIPLSCFAGLKLHTSIRYPNVPLAHQIPVGIRFVGLMALFFGISAIFGGVNIIANPNPLLDALKEMVAQMPADIRGYYPVKRVFAEVFGVGALILGLCIAVNVVLNLRLLRWYYLSQVRR